VVGNGRFVGDWVKQVFNEDGTILYSPISAQVISILEPKEEKTFEWDQIKNDGDLVLHGTYKITSSGVTIGEKTVKKSITINIFK